MRKFSSESCHRCQPQWRVGEGGGQLNGGSHRRGGRTEACSHLRHWKGAMDHCKPLSLSPPPSYLSFSRASPPSVPRFGWIQEEDQILSRLVEEGGAKGWTSIAQRLPMRAGKQCRERWHNHLKQGINKVSYWAGQVACVTREGFLSSDNRVPSIAGGVESGRGAAAGGGAQTVRQPVGRNRETATWEDGQLGEEPLELDCQKEGGRLGLDSNRIRVDHCESNSDLLNSAQ